MACLTGKHGPGIFETQGLRLRKSILSAPSQVVLGVKGAEKAEDVTEVDGVKTIGPAGHPSYKYICMHPDAEGFPRQQASTS